MSLIEQDNSDGTPAVRFDLLMQELEKRFPHPRPYDSSIVAEHFYIEEIDRVIKDSEELNAAKRQLMNIVTGGKLFPKEGENK